MPFSCSARLYASTDCWKHQYPCESSLSLKTITLPWHLRRGHAYISSVRLINWDTFCFCVFRSLIVVFIGSADNRLRVWPLDFASYLLEVEHAGAVSGVWLGIGGSTDCAFWKLLQFPVIYQIHCYFFCMLSASMCSRSYLVGLCGDHESVSHPLWITFGADGIEWRSFVGFASFVRVKMYYEGVGL